MESITFNGEDKNETIEVSFEEKRNFLFQPILESSAGKKHKIPLLLDLTDVFLTSQKLLDLKKRNKKPYNFGLLTNVVAGAAKLSMKGNFFK